jgi:hypothetical protein
VAQSRSGPNRVVAANWFDQLLPKDDSHAAPTGSRSMRQSSDGPGAATPAVSPGPYFLNVDQSTTDRDKIYLIDLVSLGTEMVNRIESGSAERNRSHVGR